MKKYNKLVRDRIPEIIGEEGRVAKYHVLSEEEFITDLDKKLSEEVREYQAEKNLEEMADILEVLYAICKVRGFTEKELETMRREKAEKRGGYDKRLYLEYVEDPVSDS